jgi:inner membrane protein
VRTNLTLKYVLLAGLTPLFGVVLLSIGGVIRERERYRNKVLEDVARSTARSQTVLGPMLVVPYRERIQVAGAGPGTTSWQEVAGQSVLLPDSLTCHASVHVETRARGIYRAPVYRATIRLSGSFHVPAGLGLADGRAVSAGEPASMVLGISDMRGLRRPPRVVMKGGTATTSPGTALAWVGTGFSAPAGPQLAAAASTLPFEIEFDLLGTERVGIVPVGAGTSMRMESDWPHPVFTGGFLPDTRTVTARGFEATWELSRFATGLGAAAAEIQPGTRDAMVGHEVAVRFVEPVDVYRQSERAAKYGLLFVLLTFVAFFLFEVLRRLAVHPIQYGLAGAAVALFFLLLLSLSEYLAFPIAYLIAAGACVGLLAFYVGHVLRSAVRGLGFAALLAILYAVLYLLLQSEDYALLLGSLLLFVVLAAVMVVTRRIDWYRMGESAAP